MMMTNILLVMAGGSLGALSRYAMGLLALRMFGSRFPWGTLLVNLAGCFLIGLAFALAERGHGLMQHPAQRLFFITGYLGALTTFSTYALETVDAARAQSMLAAVSNLLLNNFLGAALVLLGMWAGRIH